MTVFSVVIGVVAVLPLLGRGAPATPCDAAPAVAVQTGRDTQSVLGVEQAWIRAIAQRDTSAIACILADDFLDTSWQGVLRSKRDERDALANPSSYVPHYSDWRVHLYGNTAVVRGLNVMTDASGREVARLRFTDVFAYRDGRWQAVAAQETMVAAK